MECISNHGISLPENCRPELIDTYSSLCSGPRDGRRGCVIFQCVVKIRATVLLYCRGVDLHFQEDANRSASDHCTTRCGKDGGYQNQHLLVFHTSAVVRRQKWVEPSQGLQLNDRDSLLFTPSPLSPFPPKMIIFLPSAFTLSLTNFLLDRNICSRYRIE